MAIPDTGVSIPAIVPDAFFVVDYCLLYLNLHFLFLLSFFRTVVDWRVTWQCSQAEYEIVVLTKLDLLDLLNLQQGRCALFRNESNWDSYCIRQQSGIRIRGQWD